MGSLSFPLRCGKEPELGGFPQLNERVNTDEKTGSEPFSFSENNICQCHDNGQPRCLNHNSLEHFHVSYPVESLIYRLFEEHQGSNAFVRFRNSVSVPFDHMGVKERSRIRTAPENCPRIDTNEKKSRRPQMAPKKAV